MAVLGTPSVSLKQNKANNVNTPLLTHQMHTLLAVNPQVKMKREAIL